MNDGRIVKHIGDAIFADFPMPDNCLRSAIYIQEKIRERNKIAEKEDIFTIRIGIH